MSRCASVQERLADEGSALMDRDAAIRKHLDACGDCRAFLEALQLVDSGISRLTPMPAPPALLARTAGATAGDATSAPRRHAGDAGAKRLAAALAAVVVLTAGFGLTQSVHEELERLQDRFALAVSGGLQTPMLQARDEPVPAAVVSMAPTPSRVQPESSTTEGMLAQSEPGALKLFERDVRSGSNRQNTPSTEVELAASEPLPSDDLQERVAELAKEQKKSDSKGAGRKISATLAGKARAASPPASPSPGRRREALADFQTGLRGNLLDQLSAVTARRDHSDADAYDALAEAMMAQPEEPSANARQEHDAARASRATPRQSVPLSAAKDKREAAADGVIGGAFTQGTRPLDVARRFLSEQEKLTGLGFQSASGYWANTYVPGDPAIRLLEARLQRWDRSSLKASIGDARLETLARQNWQPFDPPQNAALATYLHADKRAVHGPSRLRIQVGLQASQKRSGLRPDMNVGVVLDLRRPVDDATGAKLRALMMALARARQPGDRFSITVAGHPGGLLIAPESFRHGPIQVAMQSLFAATDKIQAPAMDLLAALHSASQSVREDDDSAAPLGASLVLLVSTASIAEQLESLEGLAHENAVAGIGLSVVSVGGDADLDSIDRLVLLGQGHRRVLGAAEDAVKLVDRELHAASRAVARAVRLRIRLAPGVELIDVLGSTNLSEQAAQRVRDAERSIDQRMARNIGIHADRGEDEEGIQIVIPSFFASDSHTVLLDVVVPGPGPVADVSVRYKDLVYRRNGIARAQLVLEDGQRARGPLELNVLKNRLAHAFAQAASKASRQLGAGDRPGAVDTLSRSRALIAGMREEIPGWDNDVELGADETLLTQYLQVLGPQFPGADQNRQQLADSLRYLAFRRMVAPHE